jgi:hypothetical protein
MRYSPRNIEIAFGHAGLTHFGGILLFNEFIRMLQLRRFLTRHLRYPQRNHNYKLSQMILSLVYPIILGLDRLETASLLRSIDPMELFSKIGCRLEKNRRKLWHALQGLRYEPITGPITGRD